METYTYPEHLNLSRFSCQLFFMLYRQACGDLTINRTYRRIKRKHDKI